jgi:hypothetical protein
MIFSLASEAYPASYPVVNKGKVRPGSDADFSPPFSAEVSDKKELCPLLLLHAWR